MQDRLEKGRQRLEDAREAFAILCEPVEPPHGELQYIHYFCGNTEIETDLKEREPRRETLYKSTAVLVRAYANLADDLSLAGYSDSEIAKLKYEVEQATKLREIIRNASGETIDLKAYEADMRYLIDTYIEAREPNTISAFGETGLLDVLVNSGIAEMLSRLPEGIRNNRDAVAETIANNIRSKIIKEHLNDPTFYDRMSALLNEILADLKARRIEYEGFLQRIAELARTVQDGKTSDTPPALDTPAKRALYSNLGKNLELALMVDQTVREVRPANFRGHDPSANIVKAALLPLLENDVDEVERIFRIIVAQQEY